MIPVEEIYSPGKPCLANAILELGGGTASFVSSEGLVVTNHHVAYTALQRASSVNSNYLTDGFLAKDRAAEIQAPGYQAKIMTDMKDVTADILAATQGITDPVEKDKKVNALIAKMTKMAAPEGSDDRKRRLFPCLTGNNTSCTPIKYSKTFVSYIPLLCPLAITAVKLTTGCGPGIRGISLS